MVRERVVAAAVSREFRRGRAFSHALEVKRTQSVPKGNAPLFFAELRGIYEYRGNASFPRRRPLNPATER